MTTLVVSEGDEVFPPQVIKDWIEGRAVDSDRFRTALLYWATDTPFTCEDALWPEDDVEAEL